MILYTKAVGFGFYGGGDNQPEIRRKLLNCDYVNVMFAYGSPEVITRQVKEGKQNGKTSWLGVWENVFYRTGEGVNFETHKREDYQENLNKISRALKDADVEDAVRGIYFDEPYLGKITKADLIEVTRFYRTMNPDKGVFICFSVTPLCPDLWSPSYAVTPLDEESCRYLTDVAFDFYDDYEENAHWYKKLVDKLCEVTKNLDVRYWFIPNAMCYKGRSDENESITQTNALYEYLKKSKAPGGIMCYSYYTIPAEVENLGNINLDILFNPDNPKQWKRYEQRLIEIGHEIVQKHM